MTYCVHLHWKTQKEFKLGQRKRYICEIGEIKKEWLKDVKQFKVSQEGYYPEKVTIKLPEDYTGKPLYKFQDFDYDYDIWKCGMSELESKLKDAMKHFRRPWFFREKMGNVSFNHNCGAGEMLEKPAYRTVADKVMYYC